MKQLLVAGLLTLFILTGCTMSCRPSSQWWNDKEACWCIAHNMTYSTLETPSTCTNQTCEAFNAAGVGINCSDVEVPIPIVNPVENLTPATITDGGVKNDSYVIRIPTPEVFQNGTCIVYLDNPDNGQIMMNGVSCEIRPTNESLLRYP